MFGGCLLLSFVTCNQVFAFFRENNGPLSLPKMAQVIGFQLAKVPLLATHEEMLLPVPEWITDGSEHESKQNVLCCQNPLHLDKELSLTNDVDPVWMDATQGWGGGSHDDASKFCESFNFRKLCPYIAYCPHGMGQEPMGGHATDFTTEGEQISYFFLFYSHRVHNSHYSMQLRL
jgi:hypothetical protein